MSNSWNVTEMVTSVWSSLTERPSLRVKEAILGSSDGKAVVSAIRYWRMSYLVSSEFWCHDGEARRIRVGSGGCSTTIEEKSRRWYGGAPLATTALPPFFSFFHILVFFSLVLFT